MDEQLSDHPKSDVPTHTTSLGSTFAAASGCPAAPAWDEIVRTHAGRVYRHAHRLTGNRHDAEDLTQDVFVRVFQYLEHRSPDHFDGFVHQVTTNLFRDRMRRKQRIHFDRLTDDMGSRLVSCEPDPAEALEHRTLSYDVRTALDALPADSRRAILLRDVADLSYDEVAAALGATRGTTGSRIHRGRAQMRTRLPHRAKTAAPSARGGQDA
jgi:RNA polymerase sigma factor (sigma-70 family)